MCSTIAETVRGILFDIMELEYVKLTDTPPFVHREPKPLTTQQQDKLREAYQIFHNKLLALSTEEKKIYDSKLNCWLTKKCYCGGALRYIKPYDFWGCENYKNTATYHITFQGLNAIIYPIHSLISVNWVTEIIEQCGLRGEVTAKPVYNFFIQSGLEDLRLKYGYKSTEKNIMGFVKAHARSKEQEDMALGYLQTEYDKVIPQQCVTFKEKGKKESFCIPDFIVSNTQVVKIIDAKLDYANDDKMDKYVELLAHFMKARGDTRTLSGAHIMYEKSVSSYFKSRHELITIPDSEYLYDQD